MRRAQAIAASLTIASLSGSSLVPNTNLLFSQIDARLEAAAKQTKHDAAFVNKTHPWYHDAHQQLKDEFKLADGWDTYGAEAPNQIAETTALLFLGILAELDVKPYRIMATVEGGIAFVFQGNGYANVEFYNDGEIVCLIEVLGCDPVIKDVSFNTDSLMATAEEVRNSLKASAAKAIN